MPARQVLVTLVRAAEQLFPESVCSILVLDPAGLLADGAAASLPDGYLAAIDGLKADPGVGTCAAAAASGCAVVTPEFLRDGKWAELRPLALSLGFVAAWS